MLRGSGKRQEFFVDGNVFIDVMFRVVDGLSFFDEQRRAEDRDQGPTFRTSFTGQRVDQRADEQNQKETLRNRIA